MTLSAYAAHRGVGKSAVSNYRKAGHVVFAEGGDGKTYVDVQRTDARLNAKLDPARGRPAKAGQQPGPLFDGGAVAVEAAPLARSQLSDVRTELLEEQKIKLRVNNAIAAGLLVPAEEASQLLEGGLRMAREKMQAIVREEAERLAAERDPRAIVAKLGGAVDAAFAALAAKVLSGDLSEDEDQDEDDADADLDDLAEAMPA